MDAVGIARHATTSSREGSDNVTVAVLGPPSSGAISPSTSPGLVRRGPPIAFDPRGAGHQDERDPRAPIALCAGILTPTRTRIAAADHKREVTPLRLERPSPQILRNVPAGGRAAREAVAPGSLSTVPTVVVLTVVLTVHSVEKSVVPLMPGCRGHQYHSVSEAGYEARSVHGRRSAAPSHWRDRASLRFA